MTSIIAVLALITYALDANNLHRRHHRRSPAEEQSAIKQAISMAGAGGIEPPNGGIKISLIVQQFQDAFGKKTSKAV